MRYENEIVGKDANERKRSADIQDQLAEKPGIGRNALLLLRDLIIAFAVILVFLQFLKPTIIFEHSMEDTLHPDDYVLLSKQAYTFGDVGFGDIVVFESQIIDDRGMSKNLTKRVIGLSGDVIEIVDDMVYRNGEQLNEPYTKDGYTLGDMAAVTVPQGMYFVLGDNRQVSKDSRSSDVGFIPREKLKGKVLFRLFPISAIGPLY